MIFESCKNTILFTTSEMKWDALTVDVNLIYAVRQWQPLIFTTTERIVLLAIFTDVVNVWANFMFVIIPRERGDIVLNFRSVSVCPTPTLGGVHCVTLKTWFVPAQVLSPCSCAAEKTQANDLCGHKLSPVPQVCRGKDSSQWSLWAQTFTGSSSLPRKRLKPMISVGTNFHRFLKSATEKTPANDLCGHKLLPVPQVWRKASPVSALQGCSNFSCCFHVVGDFARYWKSSSVWLSHR